MAQALRTVNFTSAALRLLPQAKMLTQQIFGSCGIMTKRLFFLVPALALLPTLPVLANPGLTVDGAILDTEVSPGNHEHIMVVGIDKDDVATGIVVEVNGFGQQLDGVPRALSPEVDTSPYSASGFINVDKTSFHLEPGESKKVTATINIPTDVGDGGRYAVIQIRTAVPREGMVGIVSGITVPIFLTIRDSELVHEGKITKITTSEVVSGQPVDVFTTFQNTGNHHFKVKGKVTISNSHGEILDTIHIPLTSSVIPTMSRQIRTTFIPQGELPSGIYSIKYRVMLKDDTTLDEATSSFEVKEPYILPAAPASVTLNPGRAATLETEDGRISVAFPKGAVTSEVEVSLQNYLLEELPAPPSGLELATTCFRIDGLSSPLAKKATITVKYSPSGLERVGGDASRLKLARWDESDDKWSMLKAKGDSETMTLTTTTNQLSIWAIMIAPPMAITWWLVIEIAAGVTITGLLTYFFIARRKGRESK